MIRNIIIITIFISFVLRSVISDKARDRVDVERAPRHRYRYNQPVDEIYASIPVAVVYEDKDTRDEKSLKNEHIGTSKSEISVKDPNLKNTDNTFMPLATNVKDEVDDTVGKSKSNLDTKTSNEDKNTEITTMKDTDDIFINFSVSTKAHNVTKTDEVTGKSASDNLLKNHEITMATIGKIDTTTENLKGHARLSPTIDTNSKFLSPYSTKEIHIPVAIIYDTDSDPINNNNDKNFATSPAQVPTTSTPRTGKYKNNKQSLQQNGFVLRASGFNEHKVETTSSRKRQEKNEEVQFENKFQTEEQTVLPKIGKKISTPIREHKSVIPQNEQRSVSSQKKFKSRMAGESVDSTNKNSTKTEKKRRERDPVVPIVKSKNEIFSQTGVFRYR